ncbi:MAG: hypothetical protein ACKOSR_11215, partial [Flavobacteriales bacterium]
SFEWSNENDVVLSNASSYASVFSAEVNQISVAVSDECGNSESTIIQVNVPPVPLTVLLPDDTTADCITSLILLPIISGGVGVFSYQWSDETGNVLSENLEYSSIYTSDTNVSFSAIDACGNTSTVSTIVNLLDSQISIALTSDTTTDCLSLMELQPFINGGIGNYEFTWINSLGAVVSNSQTYSEYFPESETIVLNVNDECGNFADATSYIYIPAVPVYLTAISDTAVDCITPITLSAAVSGGVGEYSFQWLNTFSGESGSDVNYTDNYTENTIIEIIVSDECSNEASAEILVQVPPVPIEIGDISDATNTCIESVLVAPQVLGGVGGYVFEWFQDGTLISLD